MPKRGKGWRRSTDRAERELDGPASSPRERSKVPTSGEGVVVIGLGRFGTQVAESLTRLGHEVLGIDHDRDVVQRWADRITHVVQADSTSETALRQLGVAEFGRVVVGIGSTLEASVLTVLSLAEVGVREIWAKATNKKHGKILTSVGASHVIYPEAAMGERVAHLITSKMLDFTELAQGFALAKTFLPDHSPGGVIGELAQRYDVTVVGVRRPDGEFDYLRPDQMVPAGATVIIAGTVDKVQDFAATT